VSSIGLDAVHPLVYAAVEEHVRLRFQHIRQKSFPDDRVGGVEPRVVSLHICHIVAPASATLVDYHSAEKVPKTSQWVAWVKILVKL
jgi:hypothetical protein